MHRLSGGASWLWWLVCGICLSLGFIVPGFWWLSIGGLVMWLWLGVTIPSIRQVIIGSLFVGTVKYGAGMSWIWQSDPLSNYGLMPGMPFWLSVGFVWILAALVMSIGMVGVWLIIKITKVKRWLLVLIFPPLLVGGEIISSFIFSIYSLGSGSSVNSNLTFGYVGYVLADLALLFPVVVIGGVYALTGLSAFVAAIIYLILSEEGNGRQVAIVSLVFLLLALVVVYVVLPSRGVEINQISVIALETKFDQEFFTQPSALEYKNLIINEAVAVAVRSTKGIVLLPEDSRLTTSFSSTAEALTHLTLLQPRATLIVDSAYIPIDTKSAVLRAFYYDLERQKVYMTDKQYLVPQGEYVTYFNQRLLRLLGATTTLEVLRHSKNYIRGPLADFSGIPSTMPGILFCFESVNQHAIKAISSEQNSPIILHAVSHSRFKNPDLLWRQLDQMLRVQAIWSNKTIVTAGNMAPSKVYYPNGQISTGTVVFSDTYWRLIEYNL